jgi:DNA-binding transcriptional LysR family regulator
VGARLVHSSLIAKFNERYPELRVEIMLNDKLLDLAKGEADIAIRATAPYDDQLFGRKIVESHWAIYASRAYVERNGEIKQVSDINRHAVVLFDRENQQHVTKGWLEKVAPDARVAARCNSMTSLVSAAKSGAGLTALPEIVGDGEKDLIRVFGPVPDLTTNFYLLVHQDMQLTPRVRAFFDFVVENAAAMRPVLTGRLVTQQADDVRVRTER